MQTCGRLLVVIVSLVALQPAIISAWGGIFNRFSPEMLSNLGYGGFGGHRNAPQRYLPASSTDFLESLLEEENEEALSSDLQCSGRRCSANEHCCSGTVCVDVDGPLMGTCLPSHSVTPSGSAGSSCHRTSDCGVGLVCTVSEAGRSCQAPSNAKKQYNEDCSTSSECEISRGLCCQLLRRHRQAPRKACIYFKDPLVCVGPVAVDQVREQVQHTANEKRLTGKAFSPFRD